VAYLVVSPAQTETPSALTVELISASFAPFSRSVGKPRLASSKRRVLFCVRPNTRLVMRGVRYTAPPIWYTE
jgi:hypothetical protein